MTALRAILAFTTFAGLTGGLLALASPLTSLLTLAGIGLILLVVAALTSAFHRPAQGHDRLFGA